MKIYRPRSRQLTSVEIEEIKKYSAAIDRAVADGKISLQEIETLNPIFCSKKAISTEELYERLKIYRASIVEKLASGELQYY